MKLSRGFGLVGGVVGVVTALSCGSDKSTESVRASHEALSATDRILSFEAPTSTDWVPSIGTLASSDVHVDGAHSAAFTITGQNAQITSAKLSSLGPISSTATLEVELPADLAGLSWQGQVALSIDAPSVGVHTQYFGPFQFNNAPVGAFRHAQINLSSAVVTALSTKSYTDLQVTVLFNGFAANSQPVLVDKLNFGQATSQPDGGAGSGGVSGTGASTGTGTGAGASGGAGGTGGTNGSAGSVGAGTGAGAGAAGNGGGAASSGTPSGGSTGTAGASSGGPSGTSGPCSFAAAPSGGSATDVVFAIKLPHGVRREDVGIATTGGLLMLDDGVRLVKDAGGFASISSVAATNRTNLGVGAEVQDVYTELTGVDLRSNAHVHGIVKTAADLTKQAGAMVDGTVSQNASLEPLDSIDWTVSFPNANRGSCSIEPDNTEVIDPGSYGDIAVKSRSHLKIRGGTYYFHSLSFEPQAFLDIDNTAGPVFIYIATTFAFSGTVAEVDTGHMNFLFGIAGTTDVAIQTAFRGILVAPSAGLTLPTQSTTGHVGSFFTRAVVAHQNTAIHQRPFLPAAFCSAGAACSSFCPCTAGTSTCTSDSDCQSGLVCGKDNGRRFDQPGGTSVCWDPQCGIDSSALACGSPLQTCGRCTDTPRECTSNGDCVTGEVCGSANSGRFGVSAGANVCWPAICETAPNSPDQCGSTSAACGTCDCSANCATKQCGDDPSDGCGGLCPGLCSAGQAGCKSDLDCAPGNVCGVGVGARFGLAAGSNVCWAAACTLQDPSKPNCGVGNAQCGACPACVPHCGAGGSGADGCGGFCGQCAGLRLFGLCIDASSVDTAPYPVPLPSPTAPTSGVGSLPGSFQVTARGTASYSIPIAVPPGRMGMEPNLSLNYTSTKANGMLGLGWTLGGLSSIARCPTIFDREGATKPVKLDATDHFCLDGQALVETSTSAQGYGEDGAEYRTEVDSFKKIISHQTGTVLAGLGLSGPDSFEVRTKDGRILTYGGTDDSVVVPPVAPAVGRIWGLSRVVDRSGNAMQIAYAPNRAIGIGVPPVQSGGVEINVPDGTVELLPQTISYGEVSGLATRFVAFSYEVRPDVFKHFSAGAAGYSTQRLTAIQTLVGGPARTYHIDYEENRPDHESRVAQVRECTPTASGEQCMQPTTLTYAEVSDLTFAPPLTAALPIEIGAAADAGLVTGPKPTPSPRPYQQCLDDFRPVTDGDQASWNQQCAFQFRSDFRPSILTGDFNGDGFDDVLGEASVEHLAEPATDGLWTLALSRGDGTFVVTSSPTLVGTVPDKRCFTQESVMDVNRDGKADLVDLCISGGPGFPAPAAAYISNGTGFTRQDLDFTANGVFELKLGDVDGDGLRDFVACHDTSVFAFPPQSPPPTSFNFSVALNTTSGIQLGVDGVVGDGNCANLTLLDIDGDGDDDIVVFGPKGATKVFDWQAQAWHDYGPSPGLLGSFKLVDMNGDGLKDALFFPRDSFKPGSPLTYNLWLNSGVAFLPATVSVPGVPFSGGPDPLQVSDGTPVDYDGDGREDVILHSGVLRWVSPVQLELLPTAFGFEFDSATVADIDGDSSPDLIEMKSRSNLVPGKAQFGEDLSVHLLGGGARAGLLQTVTDGNLKRISIGYDSRVVSPIVGNGPPPLVPVYATNGCIPDTRSNCIQRVGPLVSAHAESQIFNSQTNGGAEYRHFYVGARAGLRGRGWFGFTGQTTIETQAPGVTTTISYNNADFLLAGTVSQVNKVYAGSAPTNNFTASVNLRSELSTFSWSPHQGDFTRFPAVDSESHAFFEGSASEPVTKTDTTTFTDEFGTVTGTTAVTTAGSASNVSITARNVTNDAQNWLLGHVSRDEVTNSRDGHLSSRTTNTTYEDGTNLVATIERQPDPTSGIGPDPNAASEYQKTTFTREPGHGNVQEVCVAAAVPVAARCATVTHFDASDIFPTTTTDPMGLSSEAHFSAVDGQLLWQRDANGLVTELGRDGFGRVVAVQSPTEEGTISFDFGGKRTSAVGIDVWAAYSVHEDFKGRARTNRSFDAFGRLTELLTFGFSNAVVTSEREYDATGHLLRMAPPHVSTDTSQGVTQYTYDGFGRLSSEQDAVGSTTRYSYPNRLTSIVGQVREWFASGEGLTPTNATVVQKPRGNFEAVVRDPDGKAVVSVQGDLNGPVKPMTRFRYHPFDVLYEIDALGTTSIVSDGLGRTREVDDPATGTELSTYDGFDELTEQTGGNQDKTSRAYDADGRPTRLTDANGGLIAEWLYDGRNPDGTAPSVTPPNALGRLTATYRQAKPDAATGNWVGYQYQAAGGNDRGLLESINYGIAGTSDDPSSGAQHFSIGFEYKVGVPGQIDVVRYPEEAGGLQVQYDYDASGALNAVFPARDPANVYWKLLDTDQGIRPKTEAFGNGLVTTRDYYSLTNGAEQCAVFTDESCLPGRLRAILTQKSGNSSVFPIQNTSYAYDRNGNLASFEPAVGAPVTELYDYDVFDRLTAHREGGPAPGTATIEAYTYDAVGNFKSKTGVGTFTYGKPERPFQVTDAGGVSYGYDDAGNQTSRTGTVIPGGSQTLEYNDFNMPYRITSGDSGSAGEVDFEYDASGTRLIKRKLAGGSPSEVTFDIGNLYEQVEHFASGAAEPIDRTHIFRIFAGRQIAQVSRVERAGGVLDDPKTVYLHDDHIGSTSLITDSNGAVIEERKYGSFGEETSAIDYAATGVLSGFTSQEHDADLGLVNMRGRLYDPRLGRFTTPDPFVSRPLNAQGLNRYAYVENNPLAFVDPTGFDENPEEHDPSGTGADCSYFSDACGGGEQEAQAQEQARQAAMAQAEAAANAYHDFQYNSQCEDPEACNGVAPSTLTDPTSNPAGARAAADAALNWVGGNRGNGMASGDAPRPNQGSIGSQNTPVFCAVPGSPGCGGEFGRAGENAALDDYARFFRVTGSPKYDDNITIATVRHQAEHWVALTRGPNGVLHLGEIHVAREGQTLVPIPPIPGLVALIHSHPYDAAPDVHGVELSEADIGFARQRDVTIYAVGPDFSMRAFDPRTNIITIFEPEGG